jgi:hypothetical protein
MPASVGVTTAVGPAIIFELVGQPSDVSYKLGVHTEAFGGVGISSKSCWSSWVASTNNEMGPFDD